MDFAQYTTQATYAMICLCYSASVMQHTYVFKNKDCFAKKPAEQRLVPINQLSNNLDLGLLVIAF